jgi:hypothetical protein
MKRISIGLLILILLFPVISFAQTAALPQAPASWIAFQAQERDKRIAFLKQMNDDMKAFLSAHPEV